MRRRTIAVVVGVLALALGLLALVSGDDAPARGADAGPALADSAVHEGSEWEGDAAPAIAAIGYAITGRVEDDAGRSVPGARVRLVPDPTDGLLDRTEVSPRDLVAAADGAFHAEDLADGTWLVFADHDRHPVGGFAGPFSVPRADPHPIVIVLGSAAAIEGSVKDRAGQPIASASLATEGAPSAETDGRGEFRFGALDPRRTVVVKAEAEGYAPISLTIRLRAGEIARADFVLSAGREVAGRVVDDGRRPVAGARVTVSGVADARADSDEYGEFHFANLPADELVMFAFHVEYTESAPVTVGPDDRSVVLVLRRASSIAGTVYGPSGDTLMGIRVSLVPTEGAAEEERRSRAPRTALTNANGLYLFQQVVEGTYSLVARSEGEAGRADGVVVHAGEEKTGIDLRLGGRVSVVGRVVTQFSNEPVVGASVEARFPPSSLVRAGEAPRVSTDGRGRFRLDEVAVDVVSLRVQHAEHAPASFPVRAEDHRVDVGDLAIEPRQFGGVGMTLRAADGAIEVREVLEGLPAERSGLVAGDVVLAIDDEATAEMSLEDAVSRIRGTEGETVKLLVRRQGRTDPFELSVVRETVEPEPER